MYSPLTDLFIFSLKVLALSSASKYLVLRFGSQALPDVLVHHAFSISAASLFLLGTLNRVYLYPTFRSPLRHLPRAKSLGQGAMVMESPRGKTPLKVVKEFPDAELILIAGILGKPAILVAGPNALRDILSTNSYHFEKTWGVRSFLARIIGWGLILSEGDAHRRQRKALMPSFSIRNIRQMYDLMWDKTGILLRQLQNDIDLAPHADGNGNGKWGRVEMSEWSSRLTLDIIAPTAMGKDFQSLTNHDNQIASAFIEILEPTMERLAFLGLHFLIPEWMIRILPWSINRMINRETALIRQTCNQVVREKKAEMMRKEKVNQHDILTSIIQTGQFSDSELVDQMLTFLAAGHETTASALTWTCFELARNPDIQARLRDEIRACIPSADSAITYDVMESMPLLQGVCEETQRLYPTVPTTIRDAIVDTTVAGCTIPKGTSFVLVPYAINRHPRFWGPDGDLFRPDRWIDSLPDGTRRANKNGGTKTNYAEITFLHGPRSCIGRDFAKAELRCAVAGVIGRFEIALQYPGVEPTAQGVVTTKAKGGMHLLMRPVPGW